MKRDSDQSADLRRLIEDSPVRANRLIKPSFKTSIHPYEETLQHSIDNFIRTKTINSDDEFQTNKIVKDILSSSKFQPIKNYSYFSPTNVSPVENQKSKFRLSITEIKQSKDDEINDVEEGSLILNQDISQIGTETKIESNRNLLVHHLMNSRLKISGQKRNSIPEEVKEPNCYTFQQKQKKVKREEDFSLETNNQRKAKQTMQTQKMIGRSNFSGNSHNLLFSAQTTQANLRPNRSISQCKNNEDRKSAKAFLFEEDVQPVQREDVRFDKIEKYFDDKYSNERRQKASISHSNKELNTSLKKSTANDSFVLFKKSRLENLVKVLR